MKLALSVFAILIGISAQTLPTSQPGDVFFIDPSTEKPFLWIHAATGIMEPMAGYKPEQVYRLLLDREQSCWDIARLTVRHPTSIASAR